MIISLCGFMGAGKSTIGKHIARITGYSFIDLDSYIEKKRGMSIPELFVKEGEEAFRQEEYNSLKEILSNPSNNLILSLGGGTVTRENCAKLIKEQTKCIYLYCTKEELAKRVSKNPGQRPLLQGKTKQELTDHIHNMMLQREPVYKSCAHAVVDTSNSNLPKIIEQLLNII